MWKKITSGKLQEIWEIYNAQGASVCSYGAYINCIYGACINWYKGESLTIIIE